MKVKHKQPKWIAHEKMKMRHKEPPWVACPYCGEKL